MQAPILVEPESLFAERHQYAQEDMFAFVEADPHIFDLLRRGPTHVMRVVNIVGRRLPSRSKRQRIAIKHEILLRIGALIRRGQIRRIKRKFIALQA